MESVSVDSDMSRPVHGQRYKGHRSNTVLGEILLKLPDERKVFPPLHKVSFFTQVHIERGDDAFQVQGSVTKVVFDFFLGMVKVFRVGIFHVRERFLHLHGEPTQQPSMDVGGDVISAIGFVVARHVGDQLVTIADIISHVLIVKLVDVTEINIIGCSGGDYLERFPEERVVRQVRSVSVSLEEKKNVKVQ